MRVISPIQERILHLFGEAEESSSFYLTGGTALAHFYLKHRKSNDLDFFTSMEELIEPFSRRLEEKLRSDGMAVERRRGVQSFVELSAQQGSEATLIHLAQDAPFRFEPTRTFPEYAGLNVDGLADIAPNKLLALFGRATLRDFIDVYTLIQEGHFRPDELVEKAKQKDPGFDIYWLGVAFERIQNFGPESPEMLLLLQPVTFEKLRSFFDQWRGDLVRKLQ